MHELGMCEAIVEAVEKRAGGRPVAKVQIRAGSLLRIHAPALDQSFEMAAMGTVAADADIDFVTVPATVSCHACGREGESYDGLAVCPVCGSADVEVSGGDELTLVSLEYAATV